METRTRDDPAPGSNDLDGWRAAISDGRLPNIRLESIVAAFEDLGANDVEVQNALAKHLSDSLLRILRKYVGWHHPNQGWDIILRAHGAIFEALLKPTSADGKSLREAFVPRVLFRLKDALVIESHQRRTPDPNIPAKKRTNAGDPSAGTEDSANLEAHKENAALLYDGEPPPAKWREQGVAKVDELDEQLGVSRILECVADDRKRLAFHLYMNDLPYKSKRRDVISIAMALGVSEKTAREWIKEVREILAQDERVRQLQKRRAGE